MCRSIVQAKPGEDVIHMVIIAIQVENPVQLLTGDMLLHHRLRPEQLLVIFSSGPAVHRAALYQRIGDLAQHAVVAEVKQHPAGKNKAMAGID